MLRHEVLRREERRLRRLFGGAILGGLAGPLVFAQACSTSSGGGSGESADAAGDVTGLVDASEGGFSFSFDAAPDTYIDWCEAGAPYLIDSGPDAGICEFEARMPCSLPPGINVIDDAGSIVAGQCAALCPDSGNGAYTDCNLDDWDGATTGPLLLSCGVCGLHGGRKPAGLLTQVKRGVAVAGCAGSSTSFGRLPPRTPANGGAQLPPVPPSARQVGDYFARMAHLEAASVYAFEVMQAELARVGAPRALVRAAARAERDERRHARTTARLARRFGGVAVRPRVYPAAVRSLETIAVENAVEGCVRETYGALLATWQAHHARDAGVRRAMAGIARDETRHAALAWAFARWAGSRLDARARARVARARSDAARSLDRELSEEPTASLVSLGLLPPSTPARLMARAVLT